ncbi:transposase [Oleiharenicola lentus]|uniref:transposase n=1 Tax=Oleiharenicola lentus TaxID=2508720 RepID=UPI0013E99225|nr:transposase [Oleiharenicola lentus]
MQPHRHLAHVLPFVRHLLFFLTVVANQRQSVLTAEPVLAALTEIWRRSAEIDGWMVGDYLLMSDHVHLFAKGAHDANPLATWIGAWKSLSSRRLKPVLRLTGAL